MKTKFILMALLLILSACGKAKFEPKKKSARETPAANGSLNYAGLWHGSPVLGSGYGIRLALNTDGTYLWAASQMDGQERTRFRSGSWAAAGGKLKLTATEEIRWEGGSEVPAFASWGTETVIVEARTVLDVLSEPTETVCDISPVEPDKDIKNRKTVAIGGRQYWELPRPDDLKTLYDDYGAAKVQTETDACGYLSDSDRYVLELAKNDLDLLKNKDWGAIGHLIHPKQGLTFSPGGHVDVKKAVRLSPGDVAPLWMDGSVRNWGDDPASGKPIKMTIDEYYGKYIFDCDFTQAPEVAVDRIIKTDVESNLDVFGNGWAFAEFHFPGTGPDGKNGWASLRLVYSWYEGDGDFPEGLCLTAVVHDGGTD